MVVTDFNKVKPIKDSEVRIPRKRTVKVGSKRNQSSLVEDVESVNEVTDSMCDLTM